jgi:alpha-beta hydrolase superfamily lysophospholipase
MKHFLLGTAKHTLKALGYGIAGGVAVMIVVFVLQLERRPDLKVWHTAELDAEFAADGAKSFEDYLSFERRLFKQLNERVYDRIEPEDRRLINRYHRGSLSDPDRWSTNWNRTFELSEKAPKAGILLLHGMSDSPYSLRSLGLRLHASGAWVVGLRLPGHGTAPSGLVSVKWQDMVAAVRLSMEHLRDKVGDRPLYIVGYSNGGALAVHYAISALEDNALPSVDGMVLVSPAIGVTPLAAFAVWQARLGRLLGLQKLAWTDILPEYDPFKYGSFAVNAGDQVYRLTGEIQSKMKTLGVVGALVDFPPVLAFQSAVDATVSMQSLIDGLFGQLPAGGHELVIFDINRISEIAQMLRQDPKENVKAGLYDTDLGFTISFVTNKSEKSRRVVVRKKRPGDSEIVEISTGLMWPKGLYSLSHVALPISPNDPLYGGPNAGNSPGIKLGDITLRGERGVLQIPASAMLRLRWNPFYPYMERRLLEFVRLAGSDRE